MQPICLPEYFTKSNDVDWCTVTGWGTQIRMYHISLYLSKTINLHTYEK